MLPYATIPANSNHPYPVPAVPALGMGGFLLSEVLSLGSFGLRAEAPEAMLLPLAPNSSRGRASRAVRGTGGRPRQKRRRDVMGGFWEDLEDLGRIFMGFSLILHGKHQKWPVTGTGKVGENCWVLQRSQLGAKKKEYVCVCFFCWFWISQKCLAMWSFIQCMEVGKTLYLG